MWEFCISINNKQQSIINFIIGKLNDEVRDCSNDDRYRCVVAISGRDQLYPQRDFGIKEVGVPVRDFVNGFTVVDIS